MNPGPLALESTVLPTELSRLDGFTVEIRARLGILASGREMDPDHRAKVKMTKSWKILNIFLKKPSLDMGPITKVVAYAKKTLEIRGFLEIPNEGSIYGPEPKNFKNGSRYRF